ncbi:MAG TPA: rod shape-determining protein MreD [Acidimicrobiales bacterium]|nr:rod shape-determining protein MreD [Acidimicrobiales bacterium]
MSPHVKARLRIATLLIVVTVVQTALGNDLRLLRVAPDLLVLVSICAGVAGGAEAGALVGFFSGLLMDLFLTSTPLGLSALTYCITGAVIGWLRSSVLPERNLVIPAAALLGTVGAVLMFVGFGDLLGQHHLLDAGRSWLLRVILVESAWNVFLSFPFAWLYSRTARGSVGSDRLGMTIALPRSRERVLGVR